MPCTLGYFFDMHTHAFANILTSSIQVYILDLHILTSSIQVYILDLHILTSSIQVYILDVLKYS